MSTFGSNRKFNVYRNPQGECQAVKVGWSWPGFFFSWVWAFVKRLWGVGCAILAAFAVLGAFNVFIGAAASPDAKPVISVFVFGCQMAVVAMIGARGNSWRDANLPTRGYVFVEEVSAANPEAAIAKVIHPDSVS